MIGLRWNENIFLKLHKFQGCVRYISYVNMNVNCHCNLEKPVFLLWSLYLWCYSEHIDTPNDNDFLVYVQPNYPRALAIWEYFISLCSLHKTSHHWSILLNSCFSCSFPQRSLSKIWSSWSIGMVPRTLRRARIVAFWLREHTISQKSIPCIEDSMPRKPRRLSTVPVRMIY